MLCVYTWCLHDCMLYCVSSSRCLFSKACCEAEDEAQLGTITLYIRCQSKALCVHQYWQFLLPRALQLSVVAREKTHRNWLSDTNTTTLGFQRYFRCSIFCSMPYSLLTCDAYSVDIVRLKSFISNWPSKQKASDVAPSAASILSVSHAHFSILHLLCSMIRLNLQHFYTIETSILSEMRQLNKLITLKRLDSKNFQRKKFLLLGFFIPNSEKLNFVKFFYFARTSGGRR